MKIDLRNALLEANLREFADAMEQPTEPAFSPCYRRSCIKMLTTPRSWAKQIARPPWKKVLRTAACIALAFTLALGTLMGVSPTVRAAVMNWFREIYDGHVHYYSESVEAGEICSWRPGWLDKKYEIQDVLVTERTTRWNLVSTDDSDVSTRLRMMCMAPGGNLTRDFGMEGIEAVSVPIRETHGEYYTSDQGDALVWEDSSGWLLYLGTNQPGEVATLQKIANHMEPVGGAMVAYSPTWVPDGYEDYSPHGRFPGIGQQELMKGSNILTFQYVKDSPGSWTQPEDREPIQVTVQGNEALLWEATIPERQEDTSVEIGGVIIQSGSSNSDAEDGVLIWTDAASRTSFRIKGPISREDLLKMAESVSVYQIPEEDTIPHSQNHKEVYYEAE